VLIFGLISDADQAAKLGADLRSENIPLDSPGSPGENRLP